MLNNKIQIFVTTSTEISAYNASADIAREQLCQNIKILFAKGKNNIYNNRTR